MGKKITCETVLLHESACIQLHKYSAHILYFQNEYVEFIFKQNAIFVQHLTSSLIIQHFSSTGCGRFVAYFSACENPFLRMGMFLQYILSMEFYKAIQIYGTIRFCNIPLQDSVTGDLFFQYDIMAFFFFFICCRFSTVDLRAENPQRITMPVI